jgi:hypothetical protein
MHKISWQNYNIAISTLVRNYNIIIYEISEFKNEILYASILIIPLVQINIECRGLFGGTHSRVAERTRLFPEGKYSGKCKAIRPI